MAEQKYKYAWFHFRKICSTRRWDMECFHDKEMINICAYPDLNKIKHIPVLKHHMALCSYVHFPIPVQNTQLDQYQNV